MKLKYNNGLAKSNALSHCFICVVFLLKLYVKQGASRTAYNCAGRADLSKGYWISKKRKFAVTTNFSEKIKQQQFKKKKFKNIPMYVFLFLFYQIEA